MLLAECALTFFWLHLFTLIPLYLTLYHHLINIYPEKRGSERASEASLVPSSARSARSHRSVGNKQRPDSSDGRGDSCLLPEGGGSGACGATGRLRRPRHDVTQCARQLAPHELCAVVPYTGPAKRGEMQEGSAARGTALVTAERAVSGVNSWMFVVPVCREKKSYSRFLF